MVRTLTTPVQQRFSDIDSFHHVNNVAQQMYFDVGKVDYYQKVLGEEVLLGERRIITSRPRPPTWGRSAWATTSG